MSATVTSPPSPVLPPARIPQHRWTIRTRVAVRCGALAARLSRAAGLGRGQMIGGRLVLALAPDALRQLTTGLPVVLVTGTNGKTTTTRMLAEMLSAAGHVVASNSTGANMPDGLVAALLARPSADVAVLEIDESYLSSAAAAISPAMLLLLNLSRDQLDRVGEMRTLERRLYAAVSASVGSVVVANVDDVLMASAAADAAQVVWVAAGTQWTADGTVCPRCCTVIDHAETGAWTCRCSSRPDPDWVLDGALVKQRGKVEGTLDLSLPGTANRSNALMALAAAHTLGVPASVGLPALQAIDDVDGRYRTVRWHEHDVRLLLAKNPAGWRATLAIMQEQPNSALVICVDAQQADGLDTSWLWDVDFEQLRGRRVVLSGGRAADLAVRLDYANVEHIVIADPREAVASCTDAAVDLAATYSAFRALRGLMSHALT